MILYCRVGWMKYYKGDVDNDKPVNGGKYNESHTGHEAYNFFDHNGKFYGYVQPGFTKDKGDGKYEGKIGIESLGAKSGDTSIRGVTVVWVATNVARGQYIVGWYEDAEVFRKVRKIPADALEERSNKSLDDYNISSSRAVLLNDEDRTFRIEGMGRSNLWYGDKGKTDESVMEYLNEYKRTSDKENEATELGVNHLEGKEKEAVIKIRINQSTFRRQLLERYKSCCLCDVNDPKLLLASHIKPWSACEAKERVDVDNGLLLCPGHDRLFDLGLISFSDEGKIMISKDLSASTRYMMRIHDDMQIDMTDGNRHYLKYHRERIFKK